MKKINLAILFLASIFIFACSGNTENNTEATEISENTTEEQTEIVEEVVEETETIEETSAQAQTLKIEEIKKGDIIEGLKVLKVNSNSEGFSIQLEGEISVKGILQINEMEETLDFFIDKTAVSSTKIAAENSEFILYDMLDVRVSPWVTNSRIMI